MKKPLFNSIRLRLVFWFLVMALLPLIIAIIFTYNKRVKAAETQSKEKIIAIRDLKVDKLNTWITEIIVDLDVMSSNYEVRSLEHSINNKIKSPNDIEKLVIAEKLLSRNKENFTKYSDLYIINSNNNKVEISTNIYNNHSGKFDHIIEIYLQKKEEVYIGVIHSTPELGTHLLITKPIICLEHNEHLIGYLVAQIDLKKSLYPILLERIGLGDTGETLIVNKDGIALNELRWHDNAPLNLKITAETAIRGAAGHSGTIISKDYRGVLVLAAYSYIPMMKWGLVCKQDLSEIEAPIKKTRNEFIYLFIASTLIISVITFFLSKTISNPIIRLDKETKKITKGDFSSTIDINRKDELGSLSKSINIMRNSLHSKKIIQEGVTNISKTLIEQTSLNQFSSSLLKQLTVITESDGTAFYVLNELTLNFDPFTFNGFQKDFLNPISLESTGCEFYKTLRKGKIYHSKNYPKETLFNPTDIFPKEIITVPIKVEDIIVAFLLITTKQQFSSESLSIINESWSNINNSYTSLMSNQRVGILAENVLKIYEELEIKTNKLITQNVDLLKQKTISKEANKELEAFSYSVSHDLRAPLRHIDGFTKLLNKRIKDNIDEKSQGYFNNIISSANQMNVLIEDLLVFSRTGRKGVKRSKINMKKVIDEAIESFNLDKKGNNITVTIDKLEEVSIDPSLFIQVWVNLISNAIKFTSKTKNPKIKIGLEKDSEGAIIYYIKDNGVGFEQKYVDKLFGVFQRLHSNTEFPGTGIGLANVKRIINKHGGEIWAEGEINKGASFFIKLKY